MSLRQIIEQSWQTRRFFNYLLLPLSALYWLFASAHKLAYKIGVIHSYRAPLPVIVVGNITVGGTGKTPLVIALIEQLQKKSYKPAVISRGYEGNAQNYPLFVNQDTDVNLCGDEPALIVKRTNAAMAVGPNRQSSIKLLLEKVKAGEIECDVIISDDGLQHYALQKDIEICLFDQTTHNNNDFLLPAGSYRESQSRLNSVDFVVRHTVENFAGINICMWLKSDKPQPVNPDFKPTQSLKYGSKVNAVAGIGKPKRFFNSCRQLGFEVIEHVFADHFHYSADDLKFDNDYPILMTEKDAVKCTQFATNDYWYLPVSAQFSSQFIPELIAQLEAKSNQLKQDLKGVK